MGDNCCGCNSVANNNDYGCNICNNSKFLFFILIFILLIIDN